MSPRAPDAAGMGKSGPGPWAGAEFILEETGFLREEDSHWD